MVRDFTWSTDQISQILFVGNGGGPIGTAIELTSHNPNLLAPTAENTPDLAVPRLSIASESAISALPVWQWQGLALPASSVHQLQVPMPTITWTVNADGNWGTSSNWSTGQLPGSADIVGINTTNLHTITFSTGADTVLELEVGNDNFIVSGGQLAVAGGASFANALTVSGGSLTIGGAFTGTTVNVTGSTAGLWFTGAENLDNVTINLGSSSSGAALGETGTGTLTFGTNATIDQAGTFAWLAYAPNWGTGSGAITNDGSILAKISGGPHVSPHIR